jgi:hypothetical protein
MRCPRCGAPLSSDGIRLELYQCDQCGEVEFDEEGAYVNGAFVAVDGESGLEDEEGEGGFALAWEERDEEREDDLLGRFL